MIYNKKAFITTKFKKTFFDLSRLSNTVCRWERRDHCMVCEIKVKPLSELSEYTLCINYEKGYEPRVWVVDPDLTALKISPKAHVFTSQFNRLCLYHSSEFKWAVDKDIIQTIIFWAMAWIIYYEDYKITGRWRGPEFDHSKLGKQKKDDKKNTKKEKNKSGLKYLKDYPIRY